ncbi:hypothetical protein [Actinomadura chibensis]|uniref:hypothetical protein n=1 Tax=Actinomadura chibensis TaxID=392828 RepID=UPI000A4ADE9F|nr:hypothetical protein [Actinomadura chibensis]
MTLNPIVQTTPPVPGDFRLVVGWVCGTCGGGGVASDGSTCPDCNGHGHTT